MLQRTMHVCTVSLQRNKNIFFKKPAFFWFLLWITYWSAFLKKSNFRGFGGVTVYSCCCCIWYFDHFFNLYPTQQAQGALHHSTLNCFLKIKFRIALRVNWWLQATLNGEGDTVTYKVSWCKNTVVGPWDCCGGRTRVNRRCKGRWLSWRTKRSCGKGHDKCQEGTGGCEYFITVFLISTLLHLVWELKTKQSLDLPVTPVYKKLVRKGSLM